MLLWEQQMFFVDVIFFFNQMSIQSICYTCFLLHSGSQGFSGTCQKDSSSSQGLNANLNERKLMYWVFVMNVLTLLWSQILGFSPISVLTSNSCLVPAVAALIKTLALKNGTWFNVLLSFDCLFSCILWFIDQLSSLWGLRHGSTGVSMPVDLITKFLLPAFRSLLCENRKLPFRNLKPVTFDSRPSIDILWTTSNSIHLLSDDTKPRGVNV